jgi:hypothetical protein
MLAGVHQPTARTRASVTRRALLGGSAVVTAAVLVGCSSEPEPKPSDSPTPEPDADAQVRARVASDEIAIIALYDAVMAAHPDLSPELMPLRDEHAEHRDAVGDASATTSPTPAVGTRPQAIAALIEAEQRAVAERTTACEAAAGTDVARLVALIAASEAGHAEYLRGLT